MGQDKRSGAGPRSRDRILDAAYRQTLEKGLDKLTMEGIAAEVGVGKQTLYRWWPSKGMIALDALVERLSSSQTFPYSGDVAADVTRQMSAVVSQLDSPVGTALRRILAAAQEDPALADRFRRELIGPRVDSLRGRIVRAVDEGQIDAAYSPDFVIRQLYGPLYYQLLVRQEPFAPDDAERIVSSVLRSFRP
ncbi:TetR/AcrR family transcriptional regulator [Salininema proteolyticum]|uniref:TetR/AcrR family transcriptional regulator n=1 Tax=Salininema proteolyticum TaxID=1607685 RepID=A0ABV8TZ25_9ACTN